MTDLNELQVFAEVGRRGSMTKAAAALGTVKSTISRSIARLEKRLHVRLIERGRSQVHLTESGKVLLSYCDRLLAEAENAEAAVRMLAGTPRGFLRISSPITFARTFLSPGLPDFLKRFPEIDLRIDLASGPVDVLDQKLDLAIQVNPIRDSSHVVRRLGRSRAGLFASASYLQAHSTPSSLEELRNHPCLCLNEADSNEWELRRGEESQTVAIQSRVMIADPCVHHALASGGIGIAKLPLWLVEADPAGLIRVLPEWEGEPLDLYALYPTRLSVTPKLRVFLEFLYQQTKQFRPETDRQQQTLATASP